MAGKQCISILASVLIAWFTHFCEINLYLFYSCLLSHIVKKIGKHIKFPFGSEHPSALLTLKNRALEVGTLEGEGHLCVIMKPFGLIMNCCI